MKPIPFKEQNRTWAKDQPQYLPLPTHTTEKGEVVSCWKLTFAERLKVLFKGKVWLCQLTFNDPLQPQRLSIESPFELRRKKL